MSLIQLLKFKTWETRLFKMPHLETPRFQMRRWVTVAFGLYLWILSEFENNFWGNSSRLNVKLRIHLCLEATVTQCLIWKWGVSKWGILKSLVSHVLNFKSWIKLIYDKITHTYCAIIEFNPIFEGKNMGNEAFQNALFVNASFASWLYLASR